MILNILFAVEVIFIAYISLAGANYLINVYNEKKLQKIREERRIIKEGCIKQSRED